MSLQTILKHVPVKAWNRHFFSDVGDSFVFRDMVTPPESGKPAIVGSEGLVIQAYSDVKTSYGAPVKSVYAIAPGSRLFLCAIDKPVLIIQSESEVVDVAKEHSAPKEPIEKVDDK